MEDQVLTFRVSGKLWMRSLVMSDLETNTEWSHLLGRGMSGRLQGKSLETVVADMTTWSAWRKDHPQTTVMNLPRTSKSYSRDFYRDPARFVLGFEVDGKFWALSMAELVQSPVHSFEIGDVSLLAAFEEHGMASRLFNARVNDQDLDFVRLDDQVMQDTQTKSRWKISTGEAFEGPLSGTRLKQRIGIMSFRKAWRNFHPESQDIDF